MNKEELLIELRNVLSELERDDDGTLQALHRIDALKSAIEFIEEEAQDSDWF
jgi:hypothetical protein